MGETDAIARYASEFLGTFMLVFTIGCNVLTGQTVWAGVSIACVLTVMIYSLGKSSGANFNPAVSLALGITGKLEWKEVGIYCVVQLAAGAIAGVCYAVMFGSNEFILKPVGDHSLLQAGVAEMLYTFMLCFVVLNVAGSKAVGSKISTGENQFYGLAIGFVIVAGAYGAGNISGGCFNPAVVFGITPSGWQAPVTYILCEFLGAGLAAGAFWVVRPSEKEGLQIPELVSKLTSEFLGTYFLVLTVGLNVLSGSPAGAFSIAAALMSMIFALGDVSGAHFNPAVTVAIMAADRLGRPEYKGPSPQDGGAYMGVQVLGGITAAFTYAALMGGATFQLKPETSSWGQAVTAELLFTFVLTFVVLSVATTKTGLSQYFGFAIGMCVTVGGFAIGKISGGSLNPAVSFGISTSHIMGGGVFYPCLIYTIVEILAGTAAAGVFKLTQPSEYLTAEEMPLKPKV